MSRGDKASIQFSGTQLPATRSRASKGKSRSGCLPCKERRIKCNEEHPVCLRCAQQHRECVYESIRVPKWKEKTNVFSVVDGIPSLRSSTSDDKLVNNQTTRNLVKFQQFEFVTESIGQQASEASNGQLYGFSVQDKKLLDHFENFTSTNLIIPHRYWIREIIPAAFKNNVLMHAILALAACHMQEVKNSEDTVLDLHGVEALEVHHLHLAITNMRSMLSSSLGPVEKDPIIGTAFLLDLYYGDTMDKGFSPSQMPRPGSSWAHISAIASIIAEADQQEYHGSFRHISARPLFATYMPLDEGVVAPLCKMLTSINPRPQHYDLYIDRLALAAGLIKVATTPELVPILEEEGPLEILRCCNSCSDTWIKLAMQQDSITHVIVAYWYAACLLMKAFSSGQTAFWKRKPAYGIEYIWETLHHEWAPWLQFPMDVLKYHRGELERSVLDERWFQ